MADVTAAKSVSLFGISIPAGTFVFALTFTWRDMLHKRLGKEWASAAIVAAALSNIAMVLYFMFAIVLPPASFWGGQDAFASILGVVPRIAFASILAEVISQLVDTEIYDLARRTVDKQWVHVLVSNAVSLPIDSIIFGFAAFAGVFPIEAIWALVGGQILFKAVVTIVSLPGIYMIKDKSLVLEL